MDRADEIARDFAKYWAENEPFGCNPEEVAELAWNAGEAAERERCAKIAESTIKITRYSRHLTFEEIAAQIREGK